MICLTIDTRLEIIRANSKAGLKLDFYIDRSKFTEDIDFHIHESNTKSTTVGMILPIGYETYIALTRTNEIQLGEPYNNCKNLKSIDDHDTSLYKITFNNSGQYKQR